MGLRNGQKSQYSGSRSRQMSEFEVSLLYRASLRTARAIHKPCLEGFRGKAIYPEEKCRGKEHKMNELEIPDHQSRTPGHLSSACHSL